MLDIIIILAIGYLIFYIFFQTSTENPIDEEPINENTDQNGNITLNKLCLDSKIINNRRYVVPNDCNLKQDQMFNYSLEHNSIKNMGEIEKCFYINSENKIELKPCQKTYSEQFIFDKKNKQFKAKNLNNQCLQYNNKGESIFINNCDLKNPNQQFEFNGPKNVNSNITIGDNDNKCLEINNSTYNNGTDFKMKECDSNINQQFIYNSNSKTFKNKNKCINYNPNTNKIDLWDCNNLSYQNFIFDDINKLIKYENKCITIKNSVPELSECKKITEDEYDKSQTFNLSPVIDIEMGNIPLENTDINGNITINKKCLNVNDNYVYSDSKPNLATCNLKKNQMFNYLKDTKQITSDMDKNKCLEYNNNNIYFENCNSNKTNQKFIPDTINKRIKLNENNNKCMEYTNNLLYVNTCNVNNSNQKIEFDGPKDINAIININNNDKCVKSENNIIKLNDECNLDLNQVFNYNSVDKSIKYTKLLITTKCLFYNYTLDRIELKNCDKNDISQQIIYDPMNQKLLLSNKCITYDPVNNKYYLKKCEEGDKYQEFSLTPLNNSIDVPEFGNLVNKRKCLGINNNKVVIKKCKGDIQNFEYNTTDRTIRLSNNKNKCFDIGNNTLEIKDCNNSNSQKFYYNSIDKKIRKYSSPNDCIDLIFNDSSDNTGYQSIGCYDTPAQEFIFNDNNYIKEFSGPIMIRDKCVDIDGAKTSNGTKVQIYDCNDTDAQKFYYSTADYLIRSKLNTNKCLDFNGSKIYLHDCHGAANQKFYYNNEDSENMQFKQNNKCIDLNRDDDSNGTEFGLITCKDKHRAQNFIFSPDT